MWILYTIFIISAATVWLTGRRRNRDLFTPEHRNRALELRTAREARAQLEAQRVAAEGTTSRMSAQASSDIALLVKAVNRPEELTELEQHQLVAARARAMARHAGVDTQAARDERKAA